MELSTIIKLMQSCNEDAQVNISTSGNNVALTWNFMGVSHTMRHVTVHNVNTPLTINRVNVGSKSFVRALHQSRVIMRCRANLRKMYQHNPAIHMRVMRGEL